MAASCLHKLQSSRSCQKWSEANESFVKQVTCHKRMMPRVSPEIKIWEGRAFAHLIVSIKNIILNILSHKIVFLYVK